MLCVLYSTFVSVFARAGIENSSGCEQRHPVGLDILKKSRETPRKRLYFNSILSELWGHSACRLLEFQRRRSYFQSLRWFTRRANSLKMQSQPCWKLAQHQVCTQVPIKDVNKNFKNKKARVYLIPVDLLSSKGKGTSKGFKRLLAHLLICIVQGCLILALLVGDQRKHFGREVGRWSRASGKRDFYVMLARELDLKQLRLIRLKGNVYLTLPCS